MPEYDLVAGRRREAKTYVIDLDLRAYFVTVRRHIVKTKILS